MPSGCYVCNTCKAEGKEFIVPADEIGVALMKSHLWNEHRVNIDLKAPADEDLWR